jgi:hypothetical protein
MVEWMDHLLLELVTSPIFLIVVSFFFLFAIIVGKGSGREERTREARAFETSRITI